MLRGAFPENPDPFDSYFETPRFYRLRYVGGEDRRRTEMFQRDRLVCRLIRS